jgi:sulfoxide reductase heme-binding subunit YedZ
MRTARRRRDHAVVSQLRCDRRVYGAALLARMMQHIQQTGTSPSGKPSGYGWRKGMGTRSTDAWEGWSIVGAVAIALILGVTVEAMTAAAPADGVRGIMRMTARISFVLFALAFTASASWHFWPNAVTRWQMRSRRHLGVAFALSQTVYVVALFSLTRIAPVELAAETNVVTWIIGGLAYVFTVLMAFTSFESTMQLVSTRAWSALHTTGFYYIWLIFASYYFSRATIIPAYIPVAVLVAFILVLRLAARFSKSRARHATNEH